MKRGVFLLILTAGLLSLLFGTIMPIMFITYRNRLRQAESELIDARTQVSQLEMANANAAGPNPNFPFPNVNPRPGIQADPTITIPETRYRSAVAAAQDLLSRDPFRAGVILADKSECPLELRDFSWHWAMAHLPQVERRLFEGNCHAAVLSDDGKTLAVQTEDLIRENQRIVTANQRIVVVDLSPEKRPPFTLADPSLNFTLAPNGSRLAVFKGGKIILHSVADRSLPEVELNDAGPEIGFTADGSMVVSACNGQDGTLTLWQTDTGREVNRFPVQGDWVKLTADRSALVALTFAKDGPGKVTHQDVATGAIRQTVPIALAEHKNFKTPYALSNDGSNLATVRIHKGQDRLEMWDLQKGELRWAVALPPNGLDNLVLHLAFCPDGKTLASAGCAEEIRLWDAATGACQKWFPNGPSGRPDFLLWQPDGKALVVDTLLGPNRWRPGVAADRLVWSIPQAGGEIQKLSPNGHFLAATTKDGSVEIWDVVGQRALATVAAAASKVRHLEFSANGSDLAVVRADQTISLVNTTTGKTYAAIPAHENGLATCAFTPTSRSFTTLDRDGTVRCYICANGQEIKTEGPYVGAALSSDGLRVAYFEDNGRTVIVKSVRAQQEVARFEGGHTFVSLGFMRGSDVVIAYDATGCFSTWDLETKTRMVDAATQAPPAVPRYALTDRYHWTTSEDGKTIASLSDFGNVRVYDGKTGIIRFSAHSLALRKPGPIDQDGLGNAVRRPDAPSGNQLDRFALSRDGRFLMIVGRETLENQTFCQILDGLTGDEVRPVPLPGGPLRDLMFSADGSTFAVTQAEGAITLWKLP